MLLKETMHVMSEVGVTKALAQFSEEGVTASGQVLIDSGRYAHWMLLCDLLSTVYDSLYSFFDIKV